MENTTGDSLSLHFNTKPKIMQFLHDKRQICLRELKNIFPNLSDKFHSKTMLVLRLSGKGQQIQVG